MLEQRGDKPSAGQKTGTFSQASELLPCRCAESVNAACLFSARDYISGDVFKIVLCPACGLFGTSPIPAADQWPRCYPRAYYGESGARRFPLPVEVLQNLLYASRARKIQRLNSSKAGRVLDVGCGRGFLL